METHAPTGLIQGDTPEEIARDILAVSQIEAVPTLLEVLCETTGMRFAAVARVTERTWTACLVKDDINFGLAAGGQLDVQTTLCLESKKSNAPPEQPVPRMFTSTTAKPMRLARTAMPLTGPAGSAYPYPEYSIRVGYGGT